jgi:hypothetical protein
MSSNIKINRQRFGILGGALALAAIAAVVTGENLKAQGGGADVFTIEEDWELVVGQSDYNSNAPQVTCAISPGDFASAYCAFDLNYHTQPDYAAGGLQLHTWDPIDPIDIGNSSKTAIMNSNNETITWTMRMTLNNGNIHYRIANGVSPATWGTFGKSNLTALQLDQNTSLSNLNSYDPNVSLDNSGVSFGGNLVVSQTLVAVRYYNSAGQVINQITTPQSVHPR